MLKRSIALAVLLFGSVAFATSRPAQADPSSVGSATAFGLSADLLSQGLVPPTPEVTQELPPGGDDVTTTLLDIPADPVAISGTLTATAKVHGESDIESELEVRTQPEAGPYNVQAAGVVENLDVGVGLVGEGVSIVEASVVRGEAVGVCANGVATYSHNAELAGLAIAGTAIPLDQPIEQVIAAANTALSTLGLGSLLFNEEVPVDGGGIGVNALHLNLELADTEIADVIIGHAEVGPLTCGDLPECSDNVDNDDPEDELADEDDPGCHTDGDPDNPDTYDPDDDDETDEGDDLPECSDGIDNGDPEDTIADEDDPGCHTDGDPNNPDSYDPNDDDETDEGGDLPRTGGELELYLLVGGALTAGALALRSLRRGGSTA